MLIGRILRPNTTMCKKVLLRFKFWHPGKFNLGNHRATAVRRISIMQHQNREFPNNFPEYHQDWNKFNTPYNLETKLVNRVWQQKLQFHIDVNLGMLEKRKQSHLDWSDFSVYTGPPGISMLYFYMANIYDDQDCKPLLKKSLSYVEPVLESLKGYHFTFLCGDPGPLAISAVVYHQLGMTPKCENALKRLQDLHKAVINDLHKVPDEQLYGKTGYLFALLFVQKHIAKGCIDSTIIQKIIKSVINSGMELSKKEKWNCPLMYKWNDEYYLGAAHGVSGILFMLMQVSEFLTPDEKVNLIKPTIDYLISLKFPSGNYPAVLKDKTDHLVHWCHGAPGLIYMFAMAFKVFGDERYLQEALSCGEVIWKSGLLKKGYGLCHGTAGNAFAFLLLYRITSDPKHLYRATKFAEWCFEMEKRTCRTPDTPFSLFEGLAGTIYFFASMLDVKNASFPGFEI